MMQLRKRIKLVKKLIFLFIFFCVTSNANGSSTKWQIDYDSDENWILIDAFGMVSNSLFAISMNKNNCDELDVDFYLNSYETKRADIGFKFNMLITEKPHDGGEYRSYDNEVFVEYSEIREGHIVYIVSDRYTYKTAEWIDVLMMNSPFNYKMDLQKHHDEEFNIDIEYVLSNPSDIWDLSRLKVIMIDAYRTCRFNSDNWKTQNL